MGSGRVRAPGRRCGPAVSSSPYSVRLRPRLVESLSGSGAPDPRLICTRALPRVAGKAKVGIARALICPCPGALPTSEYQPRRGLSMGYLEANDAAALQINHVQLVIAPGVCVRATSDFEKAEK